MNAWFGAALLAACGSGDAGVPVPEGTAHLVVDDAGVHLDGGGEITTKRLEADPTQEIDEALVELLSGHAGRPFRVDAPADLPFWKLRRVLGSARAAGLTDASFLVQGTDEVIAVARPDRFGLGGRCREPLPVSGVEPLVTVSVQSGMDGAWVVATATFLPLLPSGPVDGHGPECLSVPACDVLFRGDAERAACAKGEGARRVDLGGEYGCLLPIAKAPEQVTAWREDLPALVERLGLKERRLLVVMPEAKTRLDALAAVLSGFADAGLRAPLGTGSLVEGNDGPPVCTAVVRDRATFAAAGAAWVGGLRAAQPAPSGPDAIPETPSEGGTVGTP